MVYIIVALVIGFVIGLIMKSTMSSVNPTENASFYIRDNSLKFSVKDDTYLYSRTIKTGEKK